MPAAGSQWLPNWSCSTGRAWSSKYGFCFLLLSTAAALAQTLGSRTPEQMMVEAYRQLMNAPTQIETQFWAPERWYTLRTVNWIADYKRCRGGSPPVWHASQGQPKLTDVDITPVPSNGDEAQVLVSFKNQGRAEQRIFFFRNQAGEWRIDDVMASGGRSLVTSGPACR